MRKLVSRDPSRRDFGLCFRSDCDLRRLPVPRVRPSVGRGLLLGGNRMKFTLRLPRHDITRWAKRYATTQDVAPLAFGSAANHRGYLTKAEFLGLAKWKTPRTQKRCKANSDDFIQVVTQTALATTDERLRIEVLTLLDGVRLPTASVLLHFCGRDPYPILDFRALWSLSCDVSAKNYDFTLWQSYCDFTRALAVDAGVSMRVLDRALWQYSKDCQPG